MHFDRGITQNPVQHSNRRSSTPYYNQETRKDTATEANIHGSNQANVTYEELLFDPHRSAHRFQESRRALNNSYASNQSTPELNDKDLYGHFRAELEWANSFILDASIYAAKDLLLIIKQLGVRSIKPCYNNRCYKSSAFKRSIRANALITDFLIAYKSKIEAIQIELQDADSVESAGPLLSPYRYVTEEWNKNFAKRHHPHYGFTNKSPLLYDPFDPPESNGDRTAQLKCIVYRADDVLLEELDEKTGTEEAECTYYNTQPLALYMNSASDVVPLADVLSNNALERYRIQITCILLRTATYIKKFPDFHGNRIDTYKSLGINLTDYPTSEFKKYNPSGFTA